MHKYFLFFSLFTLVLSANIKENYIPLDTFNKNLQKELQQYKKKALLEKKFISLDDNLYKDYIPYNINVNEELSAPARRVVEDTVYMQVFMLGTMGILLALPESVSKWDPSELEDKSLSERWKEHVKAGPVWDKDDFVINYIGHPVSGAWYYTMARNDGLNEFDSFLYSVFVSTCIWEYGYEAFAEVPSIQDLFATPIIGSLLGEYFHYLELKLDKNHGEIWGSSSLGSISYFFLDPIGKVTNELSQFFDVTVTMKIEAYNPYINQRYENYNNYIINKPPEFQEINYTLITNFEF